MAFIDALFKVKDGVAVFTLNNPTERNALTTPNFENDFPELIRIVRTDPTLRAVILTGAGGVFSAGGNIRNMKERATQTVPERSHMLRAIHEWLPDLLDLPVPLIAAVDGFCFGAGLSVALTADFVLSSDRARFSCVFGRIGLVPDVGLMYTLPRFVGLQKAKELVFTARSFGAEEGREMGLVHSIHPAADLMDAAQELGGRFRTASRNAIQHSKKILNQSYQQDQRTMGALEVSAQVEVRESAYHQEAVNRFMDKQPSLFDWDAMDKAAAKKG